MRDFLSSMKEDFHDDRVEDDDCGEREVDAEWFDETLRLQQHTLYHHHR